MAKSQLEKLSRRQLVRLLVREKERNEELEAQLKEAREKLDKQILSCETTGDLAKAALELSGVFEAAQKAADLYLNSVKALNPADTGTDDAEKGGDSTDELKTSELIRTMIMMTFLKSHWKKPGLSLKGLTMVKGIERL